MAVTLVNSEKCCLNATVALADLCATPAGRIEQKGMMAALRSPENQRGFQQMFNSIETSNGRPQNGDDPVKVEVRFRKPSCVTTSQTDPDLCDAGTATTTPYKYLQPEVNLIRSYSWSHNLEEFRELCESPSERQAINLRDIAEDIINDVNGDLITEAFNEMGQYDNGNASTGVNNETIPIIHSDGYLNTGAYAKISSEMRKQGCTNRPILVGGDRAAAADDLLRLGGTGTSLNVQAGATRSVVTSHYDHNFDSVVSPLQVAAGGTAGQFGYVWQPGSLQMLEWYKNTGMWEIFDDNFFRTTITIDGVKFDYSGKFNECGNMLWTFHLSKHFGFWCIPASEFAPCYDTSGRVMYELGCGVFDCTVI